MAKYKITYFADGERKIVETKVEETTETQAQLLGHSHVISAELVVEKAPKGKKKVQVVEEVKEETPVKEELEEKE